MSPGERKEATHSCQLNNQSAPVRKAVAKTEGLRRVRDDKVNLMQTDDYVCIEPSTPLRQAIEVMKQDEGGCAIVCADDRVVGIFTERDLLTKIIGEEIDLNAPVSNWMSPVVSTLTPDAHDRRRRGHDECEEFSKYPAGQGWQTGRLDLGL